MNRTISFSKRNLIEILRDPIIYIFCIGFPVVMIVLFQIINTYTNGNTPTFSLPSLLPAIIMFSYSFVMLTMALLVSKDKQTFFLKRLYSSPMKHYEFVLGYSSIGILIGLLQTIICISTTFIVSLIIGQSFISFGTCLLLTLSQLPILLCFVFIGTLFGALLNDKSAPGICSVLISVAGILGGCWMPLESMGGFETFCRILPFYPSVYIGRIITNASNSVGQVYTFDNVAKLGSLPIIITLCISIIGSFLVFNKTMTSDK